MMIYLLPTPLWNKEDITVRTLRMLRELDIFFCEHTAQVRKLFYMYEIPLEKKKFYPLRPWNISSLPEWDIGIMSDAWLPWFSDPWKEVVRYCQEKEREFTILPWACALPLAVISSWFDTHHFAFWWFIPHKKGRQTMLKAICESTMPIFVYESVHRVHKTLLMLQEFWYDGLVSISREISKKHEQLITAPLPKILSDWDEGLIVEKWEFVLGFGR